MDLVKQESDFSDQDTKDVNKFIEEGCPGLAKLTSDEELVNQMFGLYMVGKTYSDISQGICVKKPLVLYMAAKMGWCDKRLAYINEIQNSMMQKITSTRVKSIDFVTDLINMHHKMYSEQMAKYMATGQKRYIKDLDFKSLGPYFKSIELLEKMITTNGLKADHQKTKSNKTATININTPHGTSIKTVGDDTIEITPSSTGDVLKRLSKLKDEKNKDK